MAPTGSGGGRRSLRRAAGGLRRRVVAERSARATLRALVAPPPERFGSFGRGSAIVPPARIEHPEGIYLAEDVLVLEHAWFALEQLPGRPPPRLELGAGTRINRFVKIECLVAVTLGEGVLVADRVHIGDVDLLPATGPARLELADPQPITIGDRAFIGAGSIIKPGVTIGEGAYVSAASIVTRDVPAHSLVLGAPARVVRRWDPSGGPGAV